MPNVRCHTRIEVITYTNQTLVKLRCSFLWGQVWTWTGPGPTPRSGSAEGQGQGQTQCGLDLEGQGQVRKIGPRPGPDRTADSLVSALSDGFWWHGARNGTGVDSDVATACDVF